MNANELLTPLMSLEEKLEAIDKAMELAMAKQRIDSGVEVPIDPAELLSCSSCQ